MTARLPVIDHATKLLVIVSMAAAIALEALLASRGWAELLPLTIGSFLAAAVLSLAIGEGSAGVVLFFTYLVPAVFITARGTFFVFDQTVWVAALLGTIVPVSIRSPWAFASRWKAPLILWALTIAATWPVVVLRELDFRIGVLGIGPRPIPGDVYAATWICDVATTLGVGILWFDWLSNVFKGDETRLRRRILVALAASWAIATAVGIYQLFGDMQFLNSGLFAWLRRASGTMRDANPFGVVAAIGGPALVAAASLTRNRPLRALAICGIVASWLGTWASASRTAFAESLIASAFLAAAMWAPLSLHVSRRARRGLAALTLLAAAGLVSAIVLLPAGSGPLPRLRNTLPSRSISSLSGFGKEMWNRNGYGLVSTDLIRQFPLFGVGVGSFHLLVSDYSYILTRVPLPADNAQNWYRHQFVEHGLVGSIGWILWVVMFGWFVLSTKAPQQTRVAARTVKGVLVGLAVISLVGMPTQSIAVTITLWTCAYWYLTLVGVPGSAGGEPTPARLGTTTWVAIAAIVAAAIGGTAYTARYRLRIPQRAAAADWPYYYGFADPKHTVDLGGHSTAWADQRAVAVLAPAARWVKLTLSVDRLNLARGPVDVKVWCDNELTLTTRISDPEPRTWYIFVPYTQARMILDTWVSRSVRPADFGMQDNRALGLLVDWDFVEIPPPGAIVVTR